MSHKHYINETGSLLREVVRASEMIEARATVNASPFKKDSLFEYTRKKLVKCLIKLAEKSSGFDFYTDNTLHELVVIDPRIRSILLKYINNGFIQSWTVDVITQVKSYIVGITIKVNDLETPEGLILKLSGASGCGVGYNINQAMIPALAELVERHSYAIFDRKKLIYGSQKNLSKSNAVSLEKFRFFTEEQQQSRSEFSKNQFNEETEIYWVRAKEFTFGRSVLIPAQLVYVFFSNMYKEQPVFFETNSSGTASHSNKKEAQFRAIAEVIERDAFLLHWLNSITPKKIRKDSINSKEIQDLIKNIEKQSFKLEILNLTTDIDIPVIVSIIHGSRNRSFVAIGASCDFNITNALRKSLFEAARVAQFFADPDQDQLKKSIEKYPFFTTFKERHAWWTLPENQKHLNFLLSGKEINLEDVQKREAKEPEKISEKLKLIKLILKEKGMDTYLVDITSKEAEGVGLYVQRAIIPDLIPIYFKEYAKPLRLKRIAEKNHNNRKYFINDIPHPFL